LGKLIRSKSADAAVAVTAASGRTLFEALIEGEKKKRTEPIRKQQKARTSEPVPLTHAREQIDRRETSVFTATSEGMLLN
jgi:hypothetical protein